MHHLSDCEGKSSSSVSITKAGKSWDSTLTECEALLHWSFQLTKLLQFFLKVELIRYLHHSLKSYAKYKAQYALTSIIVLLTLFIFNCQHLYVGEYLIRHLIYRTGGCIATQNRRWCCVASANRDEALWLADDTRWWRKWEADGKIFPHHLQKINQGKWTENGVIWS